MGTRRLLLSNGDEMVPTGGLVQVIPAEALKPSSDQVRQREILGACLEQHPTYLIGHDLHKWVPEWDAVARARVIDYDVDDKLWGLKYDSDHKTEDLNAEEMLKWVVHNVKKVIQNQTAMLRYQNQSQSDQILALVFSIPV